MKNKFTLAFTALVFVFTGAFAQTQPEKKSQPKQKAAPSQKAQPKMDAAAMQEQGMKAWMAYMTPGPMHEMMAKCNGDWKEEVTYWMVPGGEPTKSTSSCTNSMIMGNRYQETKHTSSMNGMPFEGYGILAYDNGKKIFVSTWIDNMGTGIMYLEGKWDEKNKTIHFSGKTVDPMTGKDMHVREEFKLIDDNNQFMEMYMTQNGKEFKSMEIKFSR